MGRRYGRNQKRALRARIAELEATAGLLRRQAFADAFEVFARGEDLIRYTADVVGNALGKALGDELAPHARKLLEAGVQAPHQTVSLILSAEAPRRPAEIFVLRGDVPAFRYSIAISKGW